MDKIRDNSKFLIPSCSFLFLALCLFHFFSARDLWLDEDFVFKNIVNHGYLDLFGPLDPLQSFPRLYLLFIKVFSVPFDYHVLALRFFSLVCMLGAFFILIRIFRADCRDDLSVLMTLFAICVSYRFSYYAAELKPYSMDVLVIAIFALYFHYQRVFENMDPSKKDYVIAALLPLLLFFSYAAVFVFWIVGFNFLLQMRKNRNVWRILCLNAVVSLFCFALFYWIDIRHSITIPGVEYWDGYFICYSSFECFMDKFGDGIRRFVFYPFKGIKPMRYAASLFVPFFVFATFIYGFIRLKKDRLQIYHSDSLCLLLFLELFILASLQLFPFVGGRLTLFYLPLVIYMFVKGLTGIKKWPSLRKGVIIYFIVFYVTCLIRTIYLHLQYYIS